MIENKRIKYLLSKLRVLDYIGCCNGNTYNNQREYNNILDKLELELEKLEDK